MKRFVSAGSLLSISLLFGACSGASETAPTPSPTVAPTPSPTVAPPTVTETKSIANKDGSTTVVRTFSDGSKSEERTFKTGEIATVRRVTQTSGERRAHVVYRKDNSEVEVSDPTWVEKSMDATGSALAVAARKTESGVKTGVNATVEGAKTVGSATKKGAIVAGEKTVEGAKMVGEKTKEGVKAVGKGLKKVGEKIKP
ncbi:MAG: hypothetical protein ABI882_10380 [Acidobacteriota bacterium]